MPRPDPDLVARLRAAGCVFAEDEAALLAAAADGPGPGRGRHSYGVVSPVNRWNTSWAGWTSTG